MPRQKCAIFAMCAIAVTAGSASGTTIREVLEPPADPGNAYVGTFLVTPSQPIWAFGVGNAAIEDTSISGIATIDTRPAKEHWISALISRASWDAGFSFDSIRPIGASPPSSFAIDTTAVPWQWGGVEYVAFYWLSEAGDDPGNPLAVLQAGTEYDAFKFFTSAPASPFAAFTASDGGAIITGETLVNGVDQNEIPEPATAAMLGLVALTLGKYVRRRATVGPTSA